MTRGTPPARAAKRSDVARLAGVAPTTVSLVLNRTPGMRIPEATRQRIEEAARSLGYQSSAVARALVSGRTGAIGVSFHHAGRPFRTYAAGILDGFWTVVNDGAYRLLLTDGSYERCVGGLFRERCVDGVMAIAPPATADDPELRDLCAAGFPAVFIGCRPGVEGGDYVDIDNHAAGRAATALLTAAGHRRILHIAGPLVVNTSAIERLAGHRLAQDEAGIAWDPALLIDGSYNPAIAAEKVAAAWDGGLRFTAICAASHDMGSAAVEVLRARGVAVPRQVSVAGIDIQSLDGPRTSAITSFLQPLQEIGRRAGERMLARLGGDRSPPQRILLPCGDPVGDTIVPPPA